jgi:hypothetical protein
VPKYRLDWVEKIACSTTIDADSEEGAIAKIKRGESGNNPDSEPMQTSRTKIEASEI